MPSKILLIQKNIGFFLRGFFAIIIALIPMSSGEDSRLLRVKWGINSNNKITRNGIEDGGTNMVVLLVYWNRTIFQENAVNDWYMRNATSSTWSTRFQTDPRSTPSTVVQPDCTTTTQIRKYNSLVNRKFRSQ